MNASRGNSLTEYAVIGALVALAAVGGLMIFGEGLLDQLQGLKGDMGASIGKAQAGAEAASKRKEQALKATQEALLMDGKKLAALAATTTVDAAGTQPTTTVQTAGGNGTTSSVTKSNASTIQKIALDYAAIPNHDPEILNYLTKLALAGHGGADLQYGLETDTKADAGKLMVATGQKYAQQTYDAWAAAKDAYFFIHHYNDTLSQWRDYALLPPEMMAQVDAAYKQISDSTWQYYAYANSVASNTGKAEVNQEWLQKNAGTEATQNYDNTFMTENPQSGVTQGNANKVCDQGGQNCRQQGF